VLRDAGRVVRRQIVDGLETEKPVLDIGRGRCDLLKVAPAYGAGHHGDNGEKTRAEYEECRG
jgi:hypothetical protein